MNAIISDCNFSLLTQGKIDLDNYVVTDSLSTIHRWNLLGRLYHSSELNSARICANIEAAFQQKGPLPLTEKERSCATENLKKLLTKFCKTKDPIKEKACQEVLERVISSLNPREALPSSVIEQAPADSPVPQHGNAQPVPTRLMPPLVELRYQQRYHYQLDQRPRCVDHFGSSNLDAVIDSHPSLAEPASTERAGQFLFLCNYRKDKIASFNEAFLRQISLYFNEPAKVLEAAFDIPFSQVTALTMELKEGKAEFTHDQMYNIFQVISRPEQVHKNYDEVHEDFLPFLKTDAKYQKEKAMQLQLLSLRNNKVFEEQRKPSPTVVRVEESPVQEKSTAPIPEKKLSFTDIQRFFNGLLA
ncbi:MAG: hypothetical protein KF898_01125 [Parachlamydiales bacterium]|nr:hypothetical protein [Candidatus Acheromyda pituitae]